MKPDVARAPVSLRESLRGCRSHQAKSPTCTPVSSQKSALEYPMLANPAAKFERPRVHVSVAVAKSYESRCVAILPAEEALMISDQDQVQHRRGMTFYTRRKVVDAVARGEMRFVGRHKNAATFTTSSCGTWQKTQSGLVATMQLRAGAKGRYVPVAQRERNTAA